MVNAACFIKEPLFHHVVYTLVNTLVYDLTFAVQSNLDDSKRSLLTFVGTEGCISAACHQTDFQCMNHTSGILLVHHLVMLWVEDAQLFAQIIQSLVGQSPFQCVARLIINSGDKDIVEWCYWIYDKRIDTFGTYRDDENGVFVGINACGRSMMEVRRKYREGIKMKGS